MVGYMYDEVQRRLTGYFKLKRQMKTAENITCSIPAIVALCAIIWSSGWLWAIAIIAFIIHYIIQYHYHIKIKKYLKENNMEKT